MKSAHKIVAIIFLFTYSMYITKVILPLFEYYVNYTYIVEFLCEEKDQSINKCKGMCHLADEIKKQVNEDKEKDKITISEFNIIPHIEISFEIEFPEPHKKNKNYIRYSDKIINIPNSPDLPPPKFIIL